MSVGLTFEIFCRAMGWVMMRTLVQIVKSQRITEYIHFTMSIGLTFEDLFRAMGWTMMCALDFL